MARHQTNDIRRSILEEVFWSNTSPVRKVATQFKVSPQAVLLHIQGMVRNGILTADGERRGRTYQLATRSAKSSTFVIGKGLNEDRVWKTAFAPHLANASEEARDICHYGVTEIVNNAIEHSSGQKLSVRIQLTAGSVSILIADDGVGIIQKISKFLKLTDPRQTLLELTKGKFTTDPKRHTGEGLFFTSRTFDRFAIRSSLLQFVRASNTNDWLIETCKKPVRGTQIKMGLILPPLRRLEDVFSRFSSGPEEYRFAKTHVPLKLASFGETSLISRSSARRVLSHIDRFDQAVLDFAGVQSVGQAFADEIFRVYVADHRGIELIPINANEQVTSMIRRAQAALREQDRL